MNENENRSVNKATDENTNTQNNNYEQADMPIVSEINDTVKKRGSNKKIIVGVIAAVIVVIAAAAVYASLAKPELLNIFKSDEEISLNNKEIILNATKNTINKYFDVNEETFFSKIINSKVIEKAFYDESYNPSITISGAIKDYPEIPSTLKNMGFNATIDIDKQNNDGNVYLKGSYNNIDIDAFSAYFNDEYAVFNVPTASEKLFFNWDDMPPEFSTMIQEFSKGIEKNNIAASQEYKDMSETIGEDIISILDENIEIKNAGGESVGNIQCDVYKVDINNQQLIEIIKKISDKLFANKEYMNIVKEMTIKMYPEMKSTLETIDFAEVSGEISKLIDKIDIKGVEISFYISKDELVKFETDIKITDKERFIFDVSFTGENEFTDNVEFKAYIYKNNKYDEGISFTDIKEQNGSEIKKEMTVSVKSGVDEKMNSGIILVTNYNSSNSNFDGYVNITDNGTSKNTVEFNGTLESNDQVFDINFDKFLIEDADVSFGLKISEAQNINVINKEGAIDVINNPMGANKALESIIGNLYGLNS